MNKLHLIAFFTLMQFSHSQNCSCSDNYSNSTDCESLLNNTCCNISDYNDCLYKTQSKASNSSDNAASTVLLTSVIMGISFGAFWFGCVFYYVCKKNKVEHNFEVVTASLPNESSLLVMNSARKLVGCHWIEEKYPMKYFSSRIKHKGEPICTICLVELKDFDLVRAISCSHVFHGFCIDEWVMASQSPKCPNCNADF
ncbi:unnamed protein product [Blepharisma stoltei]|uniref:RING-type domain-containing protein n=1 Tax=Blepharisma stoltei TaxID=1481888 RepID=A0AAU9IVZ4_9CILI|nr:unnamed protein product [Blepharisma stoltei]